MTNTVLLRSTIQQSGYRTRWLAQQLGISYQGFLNKMENKHEFKASEIYKLKRILKLSEKERNAIFFARELI